MNKYIIAENLTTPIAIVTGQGSVEWRNGAFDTMFGADAKDWLKEASRAVGGERGWLQGFFSDPDEHRATDVEIEASLKALTQGGNQ